MVSTKTTPKNSKEIRKKIINKNNGIVILTKSWNVMGNNQIRKLIATISPNFIDKQHHYPDKINDD